MSSEHININGSEYDPEVVSQGLQVLSANARGITPETGSGLGGADISSDGSITRWNGQQYGGDREIYDVLGYEDLDDNTALEKYRSKYNRQDIAERVIDIFPEETWKEPPAVIDDAGGEDQTDFEQLATRLIKGELNSYLRRTDRAQRLGEYGLMMVGFDDGQEAREPVSEGAVNSLDDISFYNVFPQEQVESWQLGKDLENEPEANPTHERYNKPVYYTLDFGDIDADTTDDEYRKVHWTRVVPHAAEGALETDLKGAPALKPIYNRLIDREKVIGASAEMFYTGADRKIIANVQEEFALKQYSDTGEREDFKAQLSRVVNDLQQTMVGTGMDFEVLGGQEVDPSGVVDQIDSSIAANTGIPKNKLQGNETGERSTTMDRENWFDTIRSRQTNFAGPKMVRPVIDRLISFGLLPDPDGGDYAVEWPDLNQPTEQEKAETQTSRASALQASGLAMSLSSEQRITWIQEGPDAIDMEPDTVEVPSENDAMREAFHSFNQDVSLTPPESAQNNAQRVLEAREDPDRNVEGMTETGWNTARKLASGDELTPDWIQKIHAWFARHGADEATVPEGTEWYRDAGKVSNLGWGGETMRDWVAGKRKRLTELGELEPVGNSVNATRYDEGDEVETPDGVGVVSDILTESGEFAGEEHESSEDSPTYVVATPDGFGLFKASELTSGDLGEGEEEPEELAEAPVANIYTEAEENEIDLHTNEFTHYVDGKTKWFGIVNEDPEVGFRTLPDGWDRTSVLRAWASLGGRFTSCRRDMAGEIASPTRFCAALKDEVLMTEEWRQGG